MAMYIRWSPTGESTPLVRISPNLPRLARSEYRVSGETDASPGGHRILLGQIAHLNDVVVPAIHPRASAAQLPYRLQSCSGSRCFIDWTA
ncbi:hypothetical protein BHM03_00030075 [Ensete ventricosum]|nr:hypothetical protein BHM03_00030075 [Ensete ventricosum]